MDLSVVLEDQKLNIRTTGVIIHENKLLVHQKDSEDFCTLVGGRIKVGETSEEALEREIKEEMGKKIKILGFLTIIENFFEIKMPYHEMMYVYRIEFEDKEDQKILTTINNIEGEEELKYKWIDIDKLEEVNFCPIPLRKMIKENNFPPHIVQDERKKK